MVDEHIKVMQDIQMQIARLVDEFQVETPNRDLLFHLREAFSNLNQAKGCIIDTAIAAGTIKFHHPSEQVTEESS